MLHNTAPLRLRSGTRYCNRGRNRGFSVDSRLFGEGLLHPLELDTGAANEEHLLSSGCC